MGHLNTWIVRDHLVMNRLDCFRVRLDPTDLKYQDLANYTFLKSFREYYQSTTGLSQI
jgi:hypothetical protein